MDVQAVSWFLADEDQTVLAGSYVAEALNGRGVIHLVGEMGAGKTTFCRGVLRHYGHQGAVKSPTYALVEPYSLSQCEIYHFDLFRLSDPEEFNYLGFEDYFSSQAICLVEWPEKGADFLPLWDLKITINNQFQGADKINNLDSPLREKEASRQEAAGEAVSSPEGRKLTLTAGSDYGVALAKDLATRRW